ncbi:MAG: family 78 glycoside hydrolase catalytic domain [Lentisphaeria bacterium]|nr:family 78 glycoside hydrolase catalytic domain [Lentisphaeria bacterium]
MLWINLNGEAGGWRSKEIPAPLLRKSFSLSALPRQALIRFAAPGWAVITLNGKRITSDILIPAVTQFDKHTGFCEYDVTPLLTTGENVIGAVLGNGWYNCATHEVWHFDKASWRNYPRLALELIADGETIALSDDSWKGAPGGIFFNQFRSGEHFNANQIIPNWDIAGFDDSAWSSAKLVAPPPGLLLKQDCPQCRETERIVPVSSKKISDNSVVYDFGKNFTGFCTVKVSGEKDSRITLQYSELIDGNGDVDRKNIELYFLEGDVAQTDIYIHGEVNPFVWHPEFVYHGFRYVKVITEGRIDSFEIYASSIHSAFAAGGEAEISHPIASKLLECTRNSFVSNFISIPSDCPHREKNGWTGDAMFACETGLWSFDMAKNYDHFLQILADTQRPTGQLPGIAPTAGWGYNWGSGPVWDSALFELPYQIRRFTGDNSIAVKYYPYMKKYLDYVISRRTGNGTITFGLGDWCHLDMERMVSSEFTSTLYVYHMLDIAEQTAAAAAPDDVAMWAEFKDEFKNSLISNFRNADGTYAKNEITANACMLYFKLDTSPALAEHLANQARANAHKVDFGILGAKVIPRALAEYGYIEDAFKIYTQTEYPGWGNWIIKGATTLHERWDSSASQNHIMFGDFNAWCFEYIAGIKIKSDGFKEIILSPANLNGIDYNFSYRTPFGRITVRKEKNKLDYHIPSGIKCENAIPSCLQ